MFDVGTSFPDRYNLELGYGVKQILEAETKHPYVLESRDKLVHKRNFLWAVSLDDDIEAGYIESAKLAEGRLWFASTLVFHADFFMQAKYSELSYDRRRDKLGEDFQWLHIPEIRKKHARRIPHVVRFLNKLESLIEAANKRWETHLEMYSCNGEVHVEFEILVNEQGNLEIMILRHIRALKELLRSMRRWLDKDDGKYRSIFGGFQLAKL